MDIWFYDWKTDLETPEKNLTSLILNSKQYWKELYEDQQITTIIAENYE